jgi:hypothetical protein
VVSERPEIPLDNALVIIRTDERTYVLSAVTGTLKLDMVTEDAPVHHYLLAPGLPASEKGVDRVTGYDLDLSGTLPGYVHVPNTPDPTTTKKEG